MIVEIQTYQPFNRLSTDLVIKVTDFMTHMDLAVNAQGSEAFVTSLIQRKLKELCTAIEEKGAALIRENK